MNQADLTFFQSRFQALYPGLPEAPQQKTLAIRVNTLRKSPSEVESFLKESSIPFERVAWYPDAFLLPSLTARECTVLPLYEKGEAYIQSLSSMIPALVLSPTEKDRVLDMAAAPGSKTSQLSALMGNRGKIIANDIDRRRLYKLNAVLDILGVTNVSVASFAGQALWQHYPEMFDKVLLDAPCSMEGTQIYSSAKKIKQISKLQRWMLRSAVSSAKPGADIVYSTCSMAPEENEEVIDWILKKEEGKVGLSPIRVAVPEAVPGITSWQESRYHPSVSMTMRIRPTKVTEPFFVAHLVKKTTTVPRIT